MTEIADEDLKTSIRNLLHVFSDVKEKIERNGGSKKEPNGMAKMTKQYLN